MVTLPNFIDGQHLSPCAGIYLDNLSPRTGKKIGQIPSSDKTDIDLAVAAAKRAFPLWKKKTRIERAEFLRKIADGIEARLVEFAEAESLDQGKPIHLAMRVDIPRAIENFRFFAGAILHQEEKAYQTNDTVINYTRREAMGVAGLISPWNLPLYLLTWKIAPALAAGNTVVAKPSELTSMTAHLLSEVMISVGLPKGVCNLVYGLGAKAGEALVSHPDVPLISFTGGTATAAHIGRSAAPFYKKLSLELGGKNPALIFADCDWEETLKTTIRSSFTNQGEICLCTSRIFVEESIFERFKDEFSKRASELIVGDPKAESSFMGALVSEGHLQKVEAYVERAKKDGLKVLCGGQRLRLPGELEGGYYYPPTVLIAPDTKAEIMREEVFGPVVTLTPFKDFRDALDKANDTPYGLASTVWTQDLRKAHLAAHELEAGLVWVNTWMLRDLRTPFGGMKDSGVGREGGDLSLEFYTEAKNVCIQLGPN